jgi:exodeoxyribonuclease-3
MPAARPAPLTLISWNVNGIRAVARNGFREWLAGSGADIVCLQETRASEAQIEAALARPDGYHAVWNGGERAGYSGTALLTREEPLRVELGLGSAEFDGEGRTIIAEYPDFTLVNAYFPNGGRDLKRVPYKLAYCEAFLARCAALRANGKPLIFCGDVNTAHRPIDLAHPKPNRRYTGFLPEECAWVDRVLEAGYVDSFRHFHPDLVGQYTWWSTVTRARGRNIGWRLDYFFVSADGLDRVAEAFILPEVMGSDHCPVGLRWRRGAVRGAASGRRAGRPRAD